MSRFKKLINIIYYLISIIVLAVFLIMLNNRNNYTQKILDIVASNENIQIGLTVLGAVVVFVVVIKLLGTILQKTDEKYLNLYEDDGDICISNTAIAKNIKNALKEFEEVVEYTVKIKIKNKKENAKVSVKIKCGLDEEICRTKGYYDYLEEKKHRKENESKEMAEENLSDDADEKGVLESIALENELLDNGSNPNSEETEIVLAERGLEAEESENEDKQKLHSEKDKVKDCESSLSKEDSSLNDEISDVKQEEQEYGEKVEKSEKTSSESEEKEELAPEIIDAMSVISGDEMKSSGTANNEIENEEAVYGTSEERKTQIGIDEFCSNIQGYVQDCLEDFLSGRVSKVDIKFYDVVKKDKVKKKPQVESHKKINKKNKRVK